MPEVSVIIPSYNHEAYIGQAIDSVLKQNEVDLELIIVDDGSKDESLKVIRKFHDPRLILLTQANSGAHAAINRGLNAARGEFLSILNSDDYYHPNRLKQLTARLRANPNLGLAASYLTAVDSGGATLGVKHGYRDLSPWMLDDEARSFRRMDDLTLALLTENYLSTTSNYVFTRRCFQAVGEFLPLRYVHDWDFALRVARSFGIHLEREALVNYRIHKKNTIRENQTAMIFEICWILAVHLPVRAADGEKDPLPIPALLSSIHTFGFEKVLVSLMAEQLHARPERALELLTPGTPARDQYLAYIRHELTRPPAPATQPPPAPPPDLAHRLFARLPGSLQDSLRRARRRAAK